MIVLSMTADEIYGEINRDFKYLSHKASLTGRTLQQKMLRKKQSSEKCTINLKTPLLNNWNVLYSVDPSFIKINYYLKSFDKRGVVVYSLQYLYSGANLDHINVLKYNTHFFQRYNERMNLHFSDTGKIITHFFKNNHDYDERESQLMDNGIRAAHFYFPAGLGIGWKDEARKFIILKTFVTNEMFSKSQKLLAEHIKNEVDTNVERYVDAIHLERAFQ